MLFRSPINSFGISENALYPRCNVPILLINKEEGKDVKFLCCKSITKRESGVPLAHINNGVKKEISNDLYIGSNLYLYNVKTSQIVTN